MSLLPKHAASHTSVPNAMRKGWCPGALRPMQSGDGLLVRVRLKNNALSPEIASELARLAELTGNGTMELSQRANIQLRGIRQSQYPALVQSLHEAGLLDDTPEAEAIRNIIVSPLAGLDPAAANIDEIVSELDHDLRVMTWMHALPAKFGFAIDAGGTMALGSTRSDITVRYIGDPSKSRQPTDENQFSIELSGDRQTAARVPGSAVNKVLCDLTRVFLKAAANDDSIHRMRHLVAKEGASTVFCKAGLSTTQTPANEHITSAPPTPGQRQLNDSLHIACIALPFGAIQARQLRALSEAAKDLEIDEMRLTPWRSILLPCKTARDTETVLKRADEIGLVTSPNDPRLLIRTCPGAPACTSAEAPTRQIAGRIASALAQGGIAQVSPGDPPIHLSGCRKGCAHPMPAPLTIVANAGVYDLIAEGTASDEPVKTGINPDALSQTIATFLRPRYALIGNHAGSRTTER